jgi:hypothetical protein
MKEIRSFAKKNSKHKSVAASLVLILLLVIEVIAGLPLAVSAQQNSIRITESWFVWADKSELEVCLGGASLDHRVGVARYTDYNQPAVQTGPSAYQLGLTDMTYLGGGKVAGWSADESIAIVMEGQGVEQQVDFWSPPFAQFTFFGRKIGHTQITFRASLTGDEKRYPGIKLEAEEFVIDVEVIPCYEAVTGALGTVWPKRDVCSLTRPFLLEGKNPDIGYGVSTGTNAIFFWPSSKKIHTGWYVYVNAQYYPANFTCIEVGKGKYDVIFHQTTKVLNPNDPVVDLEMLGSSVLFCPDPIYTPSIGYLISLKALNQPNICKESLP